MSPLIHKTMALQNLLEFAKEFGCKTVKKIGGPAGNFIKGFNADGEEIISFPIGKRSQDNELKEYFVQPTVDKITGEDVFIATVNNYELLEEVAL